MKKVITFEDFINEEQDKFKVIDTKTGEIIDSGLPKKIAQKLATKKKEWTSYPDREKSAISKIMLESVNESVEMETIHDAIQATTAIIEMLGDQNIDQSQHKNDASKVLSMSKAAGKTAMKLESELAKLSDEWDKFLK